MDQIVREAQVHALSMAEENAFALSQAAVLLDQARQGHADAPPLADALTHNMELWVGIQTLVKRTNGAMPDAVRSNLLKLSDFVVGTTFRQGETMADQTVDTLININLQISEGLLEAEAI